MTSHRNRYLLLLFYAACALPFVGYGAWNSLEVDADSPADWVPHTFPAKQDYEQFRAVFGAGDAIVVSWPGCTIDEPRLQRLATILRTSKLFQDDNGTPYFERIVTGQEVLHELTVGQAANDRDVGRAASLPAEASRVGFAHQEATTLPSVPVGEAHPTSASLPAEAGSFGHEPGSSPLELSREEALARLRGTFIGPDNRTTCAVIAFTPEGRTESRRAVELIRTALKKHCGVSFENQHFAGPIIDALAVDEAGQESLSKFMAPSAAIILYVCWYCLRSIRGAFLVFGLSLYCEAATLALIHLRGDSLSALLIILPPLVQVLAVSSGIHFINYYFDAVEQQGPDGAVERAVRLGWLPCTLSAGTTAVGLASLMISDLVPVRMFGAYAAAGVLLTLALLLIFIPGTFAVWPPRLKRKPLTDAVRQTSLSAVPLTSTDKTSTEKVLADKTLPSGPSADRNIRPTPRLRKTAPQSRHCSQRICGFIAGHHRGITVLSLALMAAAGWGVQWLRTSVKIETLSQPGSRILADYSWLEENVGPLVPIEVVVHFDRRCRLSFLERIELVRAMQSELERIEAVGATLSAATFAPQLPIESDDSLRSLTLPARLEAARQRLIDLCYLHEAAADDGSRIHKNSGESGAPEFLGNRLRDAENRSADSNSRDEQWRITARVSALSGMDYGRFLDRVRRQLDPLTRTADGRLLPGVSATYTGIMPLLHAIQHELIQDLFKSFLSAFAVITVVMTVVQGGILTGLISMVSNLFPAILLFGLLGWLELPMDVGSVMTASVALGIAVDNTLHFLTFFRRGLDAGQPLRDAVEAAYRHCGSAMIQSTLICSMGLLVFSFSSFVPVSRFVWMMLALLFTALVGDLLVLPALLLGPLGKLFRPQSAEPVAVPSPASPSLARRAS